MSLPLWSPFPGPQALAYRSEADELFYGGAAGGGKMLAMDTPIPTPSGWTTIGELQPGDAVFSEHGTPCAVIQTHLVDLWPVSYRLTFDDGETVEACADHRWLTFDIRELAALTRRSDEWRARRRERRPSQATGNESNLFTATITARNRLRPPQRKSAPAGTVRTTAEIASTLYMPRGRVNHAVPVASPLVLPDADLPIEPYVLGVWLGDGHNINGGLTTADPETLEEIRRAGYRISKRSGPYEYGILGLQRQLRLAGLIGNKHAPPIYLRASRQQRLALLQGLMDADGHACDSGAVEFTSTSRTLAEAVRELAVSLGSKARITEGRATLRGKDCGPKYRLKGLTGVS